MAFKCWLSIVVLGIRSYGRSYRSNKCSLSPKIRSVGVCCLLLIKVHFLRIKEPGGVWRYIALTMITFHSRSATNYMASEWKLYWFMKCFKFFWSAWITASEVNDSWHIGEAGNPGQSTCSPYKSRLSFRKGTSCLPNTVVCSKIRLAGLFRPTLCNCTGPSAVYDLSDARTQPGFVMEESIMLPPSIIWVNMTC